MSIKSLKSVTVLALVVALSGMTVSALGAEKSKPLLSKKELKSLRAHAKTKADYQRLAAHYRQQAQHWVDEGKSHEAMVREYEKAPIGYPTKYPTRGTCCRNWAVSCGLRAQKAQALAVQYEEKAKSAPE